VLAAPGGGTGAIAAAAGCGGSGETTGAGEETEDDAEGATAVGSPIGGGGGGGKFGCANTRVTASVCAKAKCAIVERGRIGGERIRWPGLRRFAHGAGVVYAVLVIDRPQVSA